MEVFMKRHFLFFTAVALGIVLGLTGPAMAKVTLKLATVTPPHHAYNEGAREYARLVAEATKGEIEIKVFPGGQLGKGERELLEGMQLGTIDLAVLSTGPVSNFSPDMGVLDLPFLFVDNDNVDAALDGPVGRKLLNQLESAGFKGLAFMENGWRNFTNSSRPLNQPGDFKGLKFRTMENPVHLASVRELGAQATPMSWGEVYTSLQTKVIDGQENPIAIIHSTKMSEVQKYLTLSGHFYSPAPLVMSLRKFNSLKPELQTILMETAVEAALFQRNLIRDSEVEMIKELEAWGMTINTVDKAIFENAMSSVYDRFLKENPNWVELVEQIRAAR
jgi:tripartite ATP-independent transporter DctP family solute receptor